MPELSTPTHGHHSMPSSQLLRIDASARIDGSVSRAMGDAFTASWLAHQPTESIRGLDLAQQPVAQIDSATIGGFFTPAEQRTTEMTHAIADSDVLIQMLKTADALLITVPMYNFGIPAALKAWIDQIVRIHETFAFDGSNFTGLLSGKTVYVAVSYGAAGYLDQGAFAGANFVEPYLRFILQFIGFTHVHVYSIEATTVEPNAVAERLEAVSALMQHDLANSTFARALTNETRGQS